MATTVPDSRHAGQAGIRHAVTVVDHRTGTVTYPACPVLA